MSILKDCVTEPPRMSSDLAIGDAMTGMNASPLRCGLTKLLADLCVLRYKVKHLSWHLGPTTYQSICPILEDCICKIDGASERLATSIIAVGGVIPADFDLMHQLSSVKTEDAQLPPADALARIGRDHVQAVEDVDLLLFALEHDLPLEAADLLEDIKRENENCAATIAGIDRANRARHH